MKWVLFERSISKFLEIRFGIGKNLQVMILCLGVSGSGKSMLLHCLKERSLQLFNGYVPEAVAVVDVDDSDEFSHPAPLLASVATVGTDFVRLSKPGEKRKSPDQGL